MVTMSDAMRWAPDPPAEPDRAEPLLRIDLTQYANDPDAARQHVIEQVAAYAQARELRALGIEGVSMRAVT